MNFVCNIVLLIFVLSGCTPENAESPSATLSYVPVYTSIDSANHVSVEAPKATVNAGKIYAFNFYLFQNDIGTGIHIIDNSNRESPKKIAFIQLPFSTEVAVKGNFLYSNSFSDLVVFDISNPAEAVLVKRISNVFPPANQKYPPFNNVTFECPDPSKGIVVRWELKEVKNAKCRR